MRNMRGLACCGCYCEDCCNGVYPQQYSVDVPLLDSSLPTGCLTCDEYLSGTYILDKRSGPSCAWDYIEGPTSGIPPIEYCANGDWQKLYDCRPPYDPDFIAGRILSLGIFCTSATEYTISLVMTVYRRHYYFNTGYCFTWLSWVSWGWAKTVSQASFNCTTASAYSLPRSYRTFSSPYWPTCNDDDTTRAPALITAL